MKTPLSILEKRHRRDYNIYAVALSLSLSVLAFFLFSLVLAASAGIITTTYCSYTAMNEIATGFGIGIFGPNILNTASDAFVTCSNNVVYSPLTLAISVILAAMSGYPPYKASLQVKPDTAIRTII